MRRVVPALFARTETTLATVIVMLGVILTASSPHFLSFYNFTNLMGTYSVTAILAAGAFVVLVSGGIDLSFTATASVAQYLAALVATRYGAGPIVSIGIACVVGIALGSVNALLTYYLRVVSIIVTIATASVYYALLIYFTGGQEIYNLPNWWTGHRILVDAHIGTGSPVQITLPIVVMVLVLLVTHLLMKRTRFGRQVYAVGGNLEAANRIGINVLKVYVLAYGYLGLLAGIAGVVEAVRLRQAVPTAMYGTELYVLAVAILGGASLVGGVGTMGGVVLGVLLLGMLQNGLIMLGVSSYFFKVVVGLAFLISVSATGYSESRRRGRRPIEGVS